jgi:hypothetical protein
MIYLRSVVYSVQPEVVRTAILFWFTFYNNFPSQIPTRSQHVVLYTVPDVGTQWRCVVADGLNWLRLEGRGQ